MEIWRGTAAYYHAIFSGRWSGADGPARFAWPLQLVCQIPAQIHFNEIVYEVAERAYGVTTYFDFVALLSTVVAKVDDFSLVRNSTSNDYMPLLEFQSFY